MVGFKLLFLIDYLLFNIYNKVLNKMFPQLPEELERLIWKSFWSRFVLSDIKKAKPVWINPSDFLILNSSDVGALQHGYTDLERTIFYNVFTWSYMRSLAYEKCFKNICNSCIHFGFPCENATYYGVINPRMVHCWDMSHYKNVTNNLNIQDYDIDAEFI